MDWWWIALIVLSVPVALAAIVSAFIGGIVLGIQLGEYLNG